LGATVATALVADGGAPLLEAALRAQHA
jgi:hypothetical protein